MSNFQQARQIVSTICGPNTAQLPDRVESPPVSVETPIAIVPTQQFIQVNVPQVHTPATQKGNALAIASLVLGILAILICWIPFLGLLALPAGLLGLVLGGIALVIAFATKRRGIATAAVGTVLSIAAMMTSVAITGATSKSISDALEQEKGTKKVHVAKPAPVPVANPDPAVVTTEWPDPKVVAKSEPNATELEAFSPPVAWKTSRSKSRGLYAARRRF